MTEPYMTYALWGNGDIDPRNAAKLLEEYIPDNVGTVYRPERVTRDQKGLRTALDWFESPDFLGEGGAVPSNDLVQSLTFDRDMQGDEVYLLALWPEVPQHEDFDFIESVQGAGITVFDLSRALDELDLSLFSRPEPTKEEKAEARAEAREETKRGRQRRKLSENTEAPEAEAAPETPADVEEALGMAYVPAPVEAAENIVSATFLAENMYVAIKAYIDDQIERGIQAVISRYGIVTLDKAAAPLGAQYVEETSDRPPFDPPYVGEDTRPYYMQKSTGKIRPADGKPRRGEEVHNFTDEEARAKGIDV